MRTAAFYFLYDISYGFLRIQQKQSMNMIRHTIDYFYEAALLLQLRKNELMNFMFNG
jgi:hypothetical protein